MKVFEAAAGRVAAVGVKTGSIRKGTETTAVDTADAG